MIRALLSLLFIFLVPFVVYAAYMAYEEKNPSSAKKLLKGPLLHLSLIGLFLVAIVIMTAEMISEKRTGAYVPAIWKDGRLIDGDVQE